MTEDRTAAADFAAEEEYFAGPGPYFDDVTDAAEQVCQHLTDHYEDLDAAFGSARLCLEESADLGTARSHLQDVAAAAEDALRYLDRLDSAHRAAVAAGIDAAEVAAAIVSGCAEVPDPNPAPEKTA